MSGLRIALLALVSNLRKDAEAHGSDVRHPRVVLENRASDAYRIVEMLDKAEAAPVASRNRLTEVLTEHEIVWREEKGARTPRCSCDWMPDWWETDDQFVEEYREHRTDALLSAGVFRDEPAPPVSRGNFDARSTVFQS